MKAIVTIMILLLAGAAMSAPQETRFFIKSTDASVRGNADVQHVFNDGFSAQMSERAAAALAKKGVQVEKLQYGELSGKPVCGDGICQGKETSTCSQDCSVPPPEEPPVEGRVCEPVVAESYGITMMNGGTGGSGVTVAVLDDGVNVDHPDITVAVCKDTTKKGIKDGCRPSTDHGTHTSSTIAANRGSDGLGMVGMAPDVTLMHIKVCGASACWWDDVAAGIIYATDNGADIVSMSLGGDSGSSVLQNAVQYARANGVLVIAAAGNDGPAEGSIDYPAAYADVVAVGAIDSSQQVASFSSRGINDGDGVVENFEVEFAAPGVDVYAGTADGCYGFMSGTSMATPHVAGQAARLWQGDAESTRTFLKSIVVDVHTAGEDSATGFGMPVNGFLLLR